MSGPQGHARRCSPALLSLLLGLPLLAGCTLIDQRTFNPDAGKRPVSTKAETPAPPVPGLSGPPPLLRIPLGPGAREDWAGPLRTAVTAARARKPDVVFDVVAVVPATGTPQEQAAAVEDAEEPAGRVARAIIAAGVVSGRVQLQARPAPDATGREVRVFVH